MGSYFEKGKAHIPKDVLKARRCYQIAAEFGCPDAIYTLAICYQSGKCGFKKNLVRAYELCEESAQGEHSEAKNNLSLFKNHSADPGRPRGRLKLMGDFIY